MYWDVPSEVKEFNRKTVYDLKLIRESVHSA